MRVLITGGTRGIGACITEALIEQGHVCTVLARSAPREPAPEGLVHRTVDLECSRSVLEACETLAAAEFDVLINNAGNAAPEALARLKLEQIQRTLMVNFISPLLLCQAIAPGMVRRRFGRIVNVSSISAKRGTPFLYDYSAAKAALNSLTQSLARTVQGTGVTVNSVCPAGVPTPGAIAVRDALGALLGQSSGEYEKSLLRQAGTPAGVAPNEVVKVVLMLIDPDLPAVNGQSINVGGTLEVA